MAKGSGFTRTTQYFRTADIAEARACLVTCSGIVHERTQENEAPKPRRSYTRRIKTYGTADEAAQGATA